MKRNFTLLTAVLVMALTATTARATDYTDSLYISLSGSDPISSLSTITLTQQDDGNYTLILNAFSFGEMVIGDVTATDVTTTTDEDGTVHFDEATYTATITNGSTIALLLGGVIDVTIGGDSQLSGDQLYVVITLSVMGYEVVATFGSLSDDDTATAISTLVTPAADRQVIGVYDLSGRALNSNTPSSQLRVIRYSDGTSAVVR